MVLQKILDENYEFSRLIQLFSSRNAIGDVERQRILDAVHSFELVARADYELVANSFTIGAMAKLYRFGEFVFPHYFALVELLNDFFFVKFMFAAF